ncbi:hypothetical protein SAMN05444008_114136 [Cnuella takakiae]|uniref:Uncharacterized protein n=2 Tax=Cnuella takakiae TaxID=1302690 RepID=A0A1M5FS26_9BACT|nr:hypothetical protein BUE76_18545 [Cnuella takakiae]SHF94357.1 hypothetical protein SAMN05444008_114136 [Cnuella takakiae]
MRVTTIIIFLISNLSCFGQTKYPDHYKTDLFDGVLFAKSDNVYVKASSANPTRKEVYAAERLLADKIDSVLKDFNKTSKVPVEIRKKYTGYKRQYFAYITNIGQKVIILSFYYSPGVLLKNKRSMTPRVADDGWDNNWRISFNTVTRQFFDFQVNSLGG